MYNIDNVFDIKYLDINIYVLKQYRKQYIISLENYILTHIQIL